MKKQKVFMFSGTLDFMISQNVMNQLYKYYTESQFISALNIVYKKDLMAGHVYPTNFDRPGNKPCYFSGLSKDHVVANCNFDGAGAILQQIYGNLNPANYGPNNGSFIEFNQTEFISNPHYYGLSESGFAYIPKSCEERQKCRLHIVFHGSGKPSATIEQKFIRNTGFDRWADSNDIILIYPQTYSAKTVLPFNITTELTSSLNFPSDLYYRVMACWDVLGIYGSNYDTKEGVHMLFIKSIIDRIVS